LNNCVYSAVHYTENSANIGR